MFERMEDYDNNEDRALEQIETDVEGIFEEIDNLKSKIEQCENILNENKDPQVKQSLEKTLAEYREQEKIQYGELKKELESLNEMKQENAEAIAVLNQLKGKGKAGDEFIIQNISDIEKSSEQIDSILENISNYLDGNNNATSKIMTLYRH